METRATAEAFLKNRIQELLRESSEYLINSRNSQWARSFFNEKMGNSNPTTPRNDDGRKKRCSCYGFFSSSAARLILPPVILIFRCQSLYPLFFTATVCSPVLRSSEEGVLPAKAPS